MTTIAISGAAGYLGNHLVSHFSSRGFQVIALSRSYPSQPVPTAHGSVSWARYVLGEDFDPASLSDATVLVHCAYDFKPRAEKEALTINVDGTRRLFEAARGRGVECLIYISSMAAFPGCKSVYGRTKLAAEEVAAEFGAWIIRPGTIYSAQAHSEEREGLFGMLRRLATKLPIVPLIDSGKQRLYLIAIEDLVAIIGKIAESPRSPVPRHPIALAASNPVMLKDILRKINNDTGRKKFFFPVPSKLLVWPAKIAETIGLNLPVRSDSIISLCNLDSAPTVTSSFDDIHIRPFAI